MTVIVEASPQSGPEITAPVDVAAVEASAEAAFAIEEVRQEGETERAEIRAEVETAHIEAAAEVAASVTREELDECRRNIGTLTTEIAETRSLMQSTLSALEALTAETETEGSPPSPNDPPESERDALPEAKTPEAESPPEPAKKKPRISWT